jgi:hypothetical protein
LLLPLLLLLLLLLLLMLLLLLLLLLLMHAERSTPTAAAGRVGRSSGAQDGEGVCCKCAASGASCAPAGAPQQPTRA